MRPLSVMLAITFAGFIGSLALLGMTREPEPAPTTTLGRGRRRAGEFPDRPARYRPQHRSPDRLPWCAAPDGMPMILIAVATAVTASGTLVAYAAGPISRMPSLLADVIAVLIGVSS